MLVARDLLQSGHITFGKYHFSLIVSSPDAEQMIKDTNALAEPIKDLSIITTLSTRSLPAAYLEQLPGVYEQHPRQVSISSQNFADMASSPWPEHPITTPLVHQART